MKQYFKFFLIAFLLNGIWEEAHSVLYDHYRGGTITHTLLLFMALKDAAILTVLAAFLQTSKRYALYPTAIAVAALLISAIVEAHALQSGRWAYADAMPVVPLIGVGLSPLIQLALTGYIAYTAVFMRKTKASPV